MKPNWKHLLIYLTVFLIVLLVVSNFIAHFVNQCMQELNMDFWYCFVSVVG